MFDFSTVLQKASEFLGDGKAADATGGVNPTELLEQAGVGPAKLTDFSGIDAEALLTKVGLDAETAGDGSVIDSVLSKLNAMK